MNKKLIVKNTKSKFVSEAFGWNRKAYQKLRESIHEFFEEMESADNDDLTKTEMLEAWFESDEYKKVEFTPETPNDFFMLGYLFSDILNHMSEGQGIPDGLKQAIIQKITELEGGMSRPTKKKKGVIN